MAFDKELLFKSRLPEDDVEIDGVGTVRVRGLSREEALRVSKFAGDVVAIERYIVSTALLDPVLTEDEVAMWQKASPGGELEPITDKISQLSGMNEGAAKETYREFEQNPDAEFRDVPGGEAGDDRGPAEG